jgi:hypothetical protein
VTALTISSGDARRILGNMPRSSFRRWIAQTALKPCLHVGRRPHFKVSDIAKQSGLTAAEIQHQINKEKSNVQPRT